MSFGALQINEEKISCNICTYDARFDHDNEVSVVRWNDNSVITLANNFEAVEPLGKAKRFNRTARRDVFIDQSYIVAQYNRYMGGVDLHDNAVANYPIQIREKT
ncbi:Transposase IS4 [Popillia japonica]|uniref:Transposase IS4 n=1 Tax=Popillia japonica TaxID=7064 RepID=A0AAW1JH66_POPJA